MAKTVNLQWTPLQRQTFDCITDETTLDGLVAAGFAKTSAAKVLKAYRAGQRPTVAVPPGSEDPPPGSEDSPPGTENPKPQKKGAVAIEVGKITITPENWGMNQYGAVLILDTYNKAKIDIGYNGTVGDFLCDICEFYRRVLGYKEVKYDGPSEGGGSAEEDGVGSIGEGAVLTEG